jgi:hypothetical protein
MKYSNVGTIEVVHNTEVIVVCNYTLGSGKNKFGLRVATPEFPDVCGQRSDVYICVKNLIAFSLKKPLLFRTGKCLEITAASVSEHGQSHCKR